MKQYFVYMLMCADGTLYTGWTLDLNKRLAQHNKGLGSKYTRARLPLILAYQEQVSSKSAALKREFAIKRLSHQQKKSLASS